MTPSNFSWVLHTMLFYHTRYVLEKQKQKSKKTDSKDEDEDEDEIIVQGNVYSDDE